MSGARSNGSAEPVDDSQEDPTLEAPAAPPPPPAPEISGYRVLKLLGRGGMGAVYLAEDETLRRRVAIKVLSANAAGDRSRERFLREARSMATLEHPNVVRVYSFGQAGETAYLVMEYVEGETLGRWLHREGPAGVEETLRIVGEIVEALDAAWSRSIVHRDIKPGNVLLDPRGGVHVADFGLAKSLEEPADSGLSVTGLVMGTPHYISPEQARAEPVDHRTDIYSLGILAHEMLTGSAPFSASTPAAVVAKHLYDPMPDLAAVRPEVPEALARLVEQMTRKDPDARPASYAALRELLGAVTSASASPSGPPRHRGKPGSGRMLGMKGVGAAMAALGLAALALAWLGSRGASGVPSNALRDEASRAPRLVEEDLSYANIDASEETLEELATLAHATGIPGLTLAPGPAGALHVSVPADQLRNATTLLGVVDALHDHPFAGEDSVFTTNRRARRKVSLDVVDMPTAGVLNLLAGASGWSVVHGSEVRGQLTLELVDVPWDLAVETVLEAGGLDAVRHGAVWIVAPQERARELRMRQGQQVFLAYAGRASARRLVGSLEASMDDDAVVAHNERLGAVVVADRPGAPSRYAAVLGSVSSTAAPFLEPLVSRYTGFPVTLQFLGGDIHDSFRLLAELSGLNVVVNPGMFPEGALSLSVRDVPWDNVWSAIAESRDAVLDLGDDVIRVSHLDSRSADVVLESVRLRNEDPAFFDAFAGCLTPQGSLHVEAETRTLLIRDVGERAVWFREWAQALDERTAGDL